MQRLVAAYQQHEQCREGDLSALPAQSAPAADHHPGQHDQHDARDRRTQHHGHRNRQHGAEHETGHVLDALAQRPGHRGGHARQRRQGSEIGIVLARRVPGQHPGCHRRKRAFGRQTPTVLPIPDRPGRGRPQRHRQPRPPRSRATPPCLPDHDTALHPPPLPRIPQRTPPANPALTQRHVSGHNLSGRRKDARTVNDHTKTAFASETSGTPLPNHRRSPAAPTTYRRNAARTAAAVELKYSGGSMKPHSLNVEPLVRARR